MYHHKPLQELVVYQIYIRSFKDSNGDGIGDLPGVIEKLDYLRDLGVDMLWLSPFCSSPNDDMGYDISDYRNIMAEFGGMADFDLLLKEAHKRGLGIMMDLVLNHSSDEHSWFVESRKSRDNPRRDYYIWQDDPNNWESYFCPDAWEYDEESGQYYLHIFGVKQPDLNWRNPQLRQEIFDMVEWWLEKGVDGFRFDAIHLIGKPEGNPDYVHPPEEKNLPCHFRNTEIGHSYLQELHEKVLAKYNPVTVGETGGTTPETSRLYVDKSRKEFDMIFHFGFLEEDEQRDHLAMYFARKYARWYDSLSRDGWDATFLGNHDMPRVVSTMGDEKAFWRESATCLAAMILTQWGTPFLYQGDEIGMINAGFREEGQFRDPHTIVLFHTDDKKKNKKALENMIRNGRDNSRTPMQWDASPHGGFSTGEPWIMMARKWETINVENQKRDPGSILNFYRKAIALRKTDKCLGYGDMTMEKVRGNLLAYTRRHQEQSRLILLNLGGAEESWSLEGTEEPELLLSNYEGMRKKRNRILLRPWEALVLSV